MLNLLKSHIFLSVLSFTGLVGVFYFSFSMINHSDSPAAWAVLGSFLTGLIGFLGVIYKSHNDFSRDILERESLLKKEIYFDACSNFASMIDLLRDVADTGKPFNANQYQVSESIMKLHLISDTKIIQNLTLVSEIFSEHFLRLVTKRTLIVRLIDERDTCLRNHSLGLDFQKRMTQEKKRLRKQEDVDYVNKVCAEKNIEMQHLLTEHEKLNQKISEENLNLLNNVYEGIKQISPNISECIVQIRKEMGTQFSSADENKYITMVKKSLEDGEDKITNFIKEINTYQ